MSSQEPFRLEQGVFDLDLRDADGREFAGSGVLVRSDGTSHVFRGGSDLEGLATDDLA